MKTENLARGIAAVVNGAGWRFAGQNSFKYGVEGLTLALATRDNAARDLVVDGIVETKVVNWFKLPKDTLIEVVADNGNRLVRYFSHVGTSSSAVRFYKEGASTDTARRTDDKTNAARSARIIASTKFTNGATCLPAGVVVELPSGNRITTTYDGQTASGPYRIIGVAEGYSPFYKGEAH